MNYDHFLEEFDTYNEWNNIQKKEKQEGYKWPQFKSNARSLNAGETFSINDGIVGAAKDDRVNHPSHYTSGKAEAIDIIEDAIKDAPSVGEGMLQAQVLKYMLRVWLKDNPTEDLKKAQWYLTRLIEKSAASEK